MTDPHLTHICICTRLIVNRTPRTLVLSLHCFHRLQASRGRTACASGQIPILSPEAKHAGSTCSPGVRLMTEEISNLVLKHTCMVVKSLAIDFSLMFLIVCDATEVSLIHAQSYSHQMFPRRAQRPPQNPRFATTTFDHDEYTDTDTTHDTTALSACRKRERCVCNVRDANDDVWTRARPV